MKSVWGVPALSLGDTVVFLALLFSSENWEPSPKSVRWVLQSARWCLLPLDLHLCLRDPLGGESEVQGAVAGRAPPHQKVALSSGESVEGLEFVQAFLCWPSA